MESFKNLKNTVLNFPKNSGFLIAYSGGADSTALLHLFANEKNVRAIHINHGLQKDADIWQQHCQQICDDLSIELICEQAQLKDASENSCRKARYDFFSQHLQTNEILLTAHHNHDQAETILLKLLRGTGINGLGGIDNIRKFKQGYIARPLLDYSPIDLREYLTKHDYKWIEDTSNTDNTYKRNFIRNEIIPKLQNHFPQAVENISRSGNNTQQSLGLLNHFCDFQEESLPLYKIKEIPKKLQATLIYHWLAQKNIPTPNQITIKQITKDFINANIDKQPHYKNKYYQLYRSLGAIYCIKNFAVISDSQSFEWNTNMPFEFPNGCGTLTYQEEEQLTLVIKFNQKGQSINSHRHGMTKKVKKLFQEHKIHKWQRQNTPFIYHNDELISLGFDWSCIKYYSNKFKIINKKYLK